MITRWQRMVRGAHLRNDREPTRRLGSHGVLLVLCTQKDIARTPIHTTCDQLIIDIITIEKLTAIVERSQGMPTQEVARTRKGRCQHAKGVSMTWMISERLVAYL